MTPRPLPASSVFVPGETITVLRAHRRRLAKLVHPSGRIEDYDQVRTVDLFERPLPDLAAIERLLQRLAGRTDCDRARGDRGQGPGPRRSSAFAPRS